jgi:hypothetical protein
MPGLKTTTPAAAAGAAAAAAGGAADGTGASLCSLTAGARAVLVDWAVSKGLGDSLVEWQEGARFNLAWRT